MSIYATTTDSEARCQVVRIPIKRHPRFYSKNKNALKETDLKKKTTMHSYKKKQPHTQNNIFRLYAYNSLLKYNTTNIQ